jgi:hypothetical protein
MTADSLFPELTEPRPTRPGVVLTTFRQLVDRARAAGTLLDEDAALVRGVEVMAQALDTAQAIGGIKGGYLAAQAFPPYQRGLHALRLPVELTAVSQGAATPDSQTGTPDWFRDTFGTAE